MTSAMVKIFAGPNRKGYNLHEALLLVRSSFFRAAFDGKFQECHEKVIHLPEDSVGAI